MGVVSRRVNVGFIIDVPSRACVSLSSAWSACPASSCAVCPVLLFASPSAAWRNASTSRSSAAPYDSAAHRASVSTPSSLSSCRSLGPRAPSSTSLLPSRPGAPPALSSASSPVRSPAEPSAGRGAQSGAPAQPAASPAHLPEAPKRACFRLRLLLILLLRILTLLLSSRLLPCSSCPFPTCSWSHPLSPVHVRVPSPRRNYRARQTSPAPPAGRTDLCAQRLVPALSEFAADGAVARARGGRMRAAVIAAG
ncbi:hypothetical protein C8J57DRAFT_1301659 [Mycena rebaudengoi]|nr:hypothetical protein C8J57DRAFT_1301659 [Mycena rebaudengoi]